MKDISELREALGRTIDGVLDGTISIEQAKAVALVAGQVNASAKLEVEMAKATDGDFRGSGFIDVTPRIGPRPSLVGAKAAIK